MTVYICSVAWCTLYIYDFGCSKTACEQRYILRFENSRNVRVEVAVVEEYSWRSYSDLRGASDSVRALHMVLRAA